MKIDAVGVATSNLKRTVTFYRLPGFEFPEYKENEDHLEPKTPNGSARLMIDSKKSVKEYLGEAPNPGNHGAFAIQYSSAGEIDAVAKKVKDAGFYAVQGTLGRFLGSALRRGSRP